MKAFVFACALGIVGASVAVACATTVVSGNAGGAGGGGVGGAGTAGRASGGGESSRSEGVGGDGSTCKVYDAGVGDAGDVWGCHEALGLVPLSECGKHGNGCTICQAPAWCAWVGQFFDCGDGCHSAPGGDVRV